MLPLTASFRPISRFGGLLAAFLFVGPGPLIAQQADDVYWDWPVGLCVDALFVPGYGYTIQQDYANKYNGVSTRCGGETGINCWHAGLDMYRNRTGDERDDTRDDPAFAAADGRVVAITDWGGVDATGRGDGYGVLVEHDGPAGGAPIYAQYLHLRTVDVEIEERVRRGQPLGTISQFPSADDHLHFEVRPGLRVSQCRAGTTCSEANIFTSCRGNGYSLVSTTLDDQLEEWGFAHPVDTYFEHRPPFPAEVATDLTTTTIYQSTDTTSTSQGTLPLGAWATALDDPRVTPEAGTTAAGGADEAWYEVVYTADDETREGFVQSYVYQGFRATLTVGERVRTGRQWQPPSASPVVDLRFGTDCSGDDCCVTNDDIENFAGTEDALLSGTLCPEPPYDDLPSSFCDKVAPFTHDSEPSLTVGTVDEANFRGGVAIEAALRLEGVDGEQVIAARGSEGSEAWALTVEDGQLVFTVRYANGNSESLRHPLPNPSCRTGSVVLACTCDSSSTEGECRDVDTDYAATTFYPGNSTDPLDCSAVTAACDSSDAAIPRGCIEDLGYRQWRHVAAVAVTDPEQEPSMSLFWDGRRVAQRELARQLVDDLEDVRIGDDLEGSLDNVRIWAFSAEEEETVAVDSVLILDSSGSMATFDPADQRKNAAYVYVDVSPTEDRVGVVDFDSDVESIALASLADSVQKQNLEDWVRDVVDSSGLTNIPAGVEEGCRVLAPASQDDTIKTGVVLTDGISPWTDEAKQCFIDNGWTLHALGFGGADAALLADIVDGTGGQSLVLPSPEDALCELQQIRARVVGGTEVPCQSRVIQLFDSFFATVVVLPEHDYLAYFSAWEGSDVVMTLTSPSGRVIDRATNASDVSHRVGPTYEVYRVDAPEPGEWRVELYGADIPVGGERVVYGGSLFSTVPGSIIPGGGGGGGGIPPDVSGAVASPADLWPPNHKMQEVEITGVTDPLGQPVTVTITGVTQDEPVDGPGGQSAPDAEGVGASVASLRAERDGKGDGRVYRIAFEARGSGGAVATGAVEVCVPHDRRSPCVDSGQSYDSTVP